MQEHGKNAAAVEAEHHPVFIIGDGGLETESAPVASTAPPTPAPTPRSSAPDEGAPFLPGRPITQPGGDVAMMTEEQYLASLETSNHSLPLTVISVTGALLCLYFGYNGFAAGGSIGLVASCLFGAIGICMSAGLSFIVAKIVGALFAQDFGSFGELLLRVLSFTLTYELAMLAIAAAIGPMFGLLFGLPLALALAVWLIGMDFFQAMVFAVASGAIKFTLTMLIASALMGAAMSSLG